MSPEQAFAILRQKGATSVYVQQTVKCYGIERGDTPSIETDIHVWVGSERMYIAGNIDVAVDDACAWLDRALPRVALLTQTPVARIEGVGTDDIPS